MKKKFKFNKILILAICAVILFSNASSVLAASVKEQIDNAVNSVGPVDSNGHKLSVNDQAAMKLKLREDIGRSIKVESDKRKNWPQGPVVTSPSAILIDISTGVSLYSKNANERLYPASITKILTAVIACENSNKDTKVLMSHDAVITNMEMGSANMGFKEGEIIDMDTALKCMMCASANEVANAIAETIAGTNDKFAEMMNQKALDIGCKNSHFTNPSGLHDENHYITASDMAIISAYAYRNEWFRSVCNIPRYDRPATNLNSEVWTQVNKHQMFRDTDNYYKYCTGGKVGGTDEAHATLVTYASKDDMDLVCVLLYSIGGQTYPITRQLFDYGFDNFLDKDLTKFQKRYTIYNLKKFDGSIKTNDSKNKNVKKTKPVKRTKVVKKHAKKKHWYNKAWDFVKDVCVFIYRCYKALNLGTLGKIVFWGIIAILIFVLMLRIKIKSIRRKKRRRH